MYENMWPIWENKEDIWTFYEMCKICVIILNNDLLNSTVRPLSSTYEIINES